MKRIYILAAAFAAMAMVSCVKDEPKGQKTPDFNKVTVDFTSEEIETKTIFGDLADGKFPTLWESDDAVAVCVNFGEAENTVVTPDSEGKTASFSAEVSVPQVGPYTFYAVHPAATFENNAATVTIPAEQNGKPAMLLTAKSEEMAEVPSQLAFKFSHLTGYAKLAFPNLEGETIQSVSVTSDKDLAGVFSYDFTALTAKEAVTTITVTPAENGGIVLACAPQTEATWTITVSTDKGTYTKTSKLPKDITSGFVLGLNVKLDLPSALYIGTAATKDELNIEEKTACEWMLANIEGSAYASLTDIKDGKVNLGRCNVIWWHYHVDGYFANGTYIQDNAKDFEAAVPALNNYYNNGGSFLLTRFATHAAGFLGATEAGIPNNCWGGVEAEGEVCADPWSFNRWGYDSRVEHEIYKDLKLVDDSNLVVLTDTGYNVTNSTAQWHIGWDDYPTIEIWKEKTGAIALGYGGDAVVAWEFPVVGARGKMLCIGSGCYDWYTSAGYTENYHTNVATLTKNAFEYLSK